jgi:chromosome segregation ATPase
MEGCEQLCNPATKKDCGDSQKAADDAQAAYDAAKRAYEKAAQDARDSNLNNRIQMDGDMRRDKGRDLKSAQEKLMGLQGIAEELKSHPNEKIYTSQFPDGITGSKEDLEKLAKAVDAAQGELATAQHDFDYAEKELRDDLAEKSHLEDLEREMGDKEEALQKAKQDLNKCQGG